MPHATYAPCGSPSTRDETSETQYPLPGPTSHASASTRLTLRQLDVNTQLETFKLLVGRHRGNLTIVTMATVTSLVLETRHAFAKLGSAGKPTAVGVQFNVDGRSA